MVTSVHIFATRRDLEPGITSIESLRSLQYALCGMYESPRLTLHRSLLLVDHLGVSLTGDHITDARYLVLGSEHEVHVRRVPQTDGKMVYAVDQMENPASITFQPGGIYRDGSLVCGHIETIAVDRDASSLLRDFSRAVTKGFKKIGVYRVGPEAQRLLDEGGRLTSNVKSPPEYDLRR